MGLRMRVAVEQSSDQALRQPGSLRGFNSIGNGLVESAYRYVYVLAQRECMAQAGYVTH